MRRDLYRCERCGKTGWAQSEMTVSWFDNRDICFACYDDERYAPGFGAAVSSLKATQPLTLGLSAADTVYLTLRRSLRNQPIKESL